MRLRNVLLAATSVSLSASFAGCLFGPSFPDAPGVEQAQAGWCSELGKLSGANDAWDQMSTCKGAQPSASAAYIKGMTACIEDHHAAHPAAGLAQLNEGCPEDVTVHLQGDDATTAEVVAARCDRMARCEKVAVPECKTNFERVERAQRTLLTTAYNRGAAHRIADCLSSSSCGADEDAARDACYKPFFDKLLWLP